MKYVKLFEHWLLEAEGGGKFDPANPDATPVMDITIGDFRKSASDVDSFLTSIFRRAMQTGDKWNPKAGEKLTVFSKESEPEIKLGTTDVLNIALKPYNYVSADVPEIEEFLQDKLDDNILFRKESNGNTLFINPRVIHKSVADKRFGEILEGYNKSLDKLLKDKTKPTSEHYTIDKVLRSIPKALEEIKKNLMAKESIPTIVINYGGSETEPAYSLSLKLPEMGDTSKNPDNKPIYDFVCDGIVEYATNGKNKNIPESNQGELTFGMAMAWLNEIGKSGSSNSSLLSSKYGYKKYKDLVAGILDKETKESSNNYAPKQGVETKK